MPTRIIIMGAAGRDFHNFNTVFREDSSSRVVAFTATQIPNIDGRRYPKELAGPLYPDGIPIHAEPELPRLIRELAADQVVFAYSDVSHESVMHKASLVLACGADFRLIGPNASMLKAKVPVVSVCAVRTGAGKSQTTRRVASILRAKGRRVVSVRHPMPYGDLVKQKVQRFAAIEDLDRHRCTIEEREEYEPHIAAGGVIYAGVDYGAILAEAQEEADVILWDGGNNDLPFYRPDLEIVVADPHRPGHERTYHPGETNLRRAHVVVINKIDSAAPEGIEAVRRSVRELNPGGGGGRRGLAPLRGRGGADPGQARPRGRGRAHPDPRRDEVRRRRPRRHPPRGGRDRGPAPLHGRDDHEDVRELPRDRHPAAGDGLRRRADEGPRGDDRADARATSCSWPPPSTCAA